MKLFCAVSLAFILLGANSCAQEGVKQSLNLGFEQHNNVSFTGWSSFGDKDFKISIDSVVKRSGKYAALIENNTDKKGFSALSIELPQNYDGEKIRLTGYIKTENVTEGHAGLWARIDPGLGFDNMSDRGISGTTDWAQFEITLPLNPSKTERIIVGGLLVGKGKMWLDDLQVTVDGMELDHVRLKLYVKESLPADEDKAFDKGSNLTVPLSNKDAVKNITLLGKVWGLLKYHHPEIAKGNYNWDYELLRYLPEYLKTKTTAERDESIVQWINKLGEPDKCVNCKETASNAAIKPDMRWIDEPGISPNLRAALRRVYDVRNQGDNYYVKLDANIGNPVFTNERDYASMSYPDQGFRLISLFRYWNMIHYFFPYKDLTDKKWDMVLAEYIPKFIEAKDELSYELAALQLIGEVKDTHANLWGGGNMIAALRGNKYAPFRASFIENKLVVVDYFNKEHSGQSKVKVGDVITHVDGKTVQFLIDSLSSYYPASNKATMLRDMSIDLLRSPKSSIALNYLSEGEKHQVDVPLFERKELNMYQLYKVDTSKRAYYLLDKEIGYVTLAHIKQADIPEIKKQFKDTKGIIIDIRNYPSTFVPFSLGSYFVTKPTSFVKFSAGSIKNPGEFNYFDGPIIESDGNSYPGKLVVLLNEISQSQAEYTAMAFRASNNVTIVGSTTAGADGNISEIMLPGRLRSMISGIGVFYPDAQPTQRVGIVPDVEIRPTIKGVKEGRDELMEKAISIIKAGGKK